MRGMIICAGYLCLDSEAIYSASLYYSEIHRKNIGIALEKLLEIRYN